ncbi:hypothetical protein CKO31_16465 [Thiohalocapsa halophila]|uniref:MacB-like periplasmic core domain-containing protein n=1 Tax=Thiohalocapsa halophila TaxID=69359 RepID=A0ABS1CK56_9GAMM|nr:ABC transporter permease [Thiohalocapsa halophila]MBK1632301.1 hypothetical protein [Thiohalocapsa halophila]
MHTGDTLTSAARALTAHPTRTWLTLAAMAFATAAVVVLTAIGEGIHRFVLAEFTQFGTNLIAVNPGRTTTMGMSGAMIASVRPLSMDDVDALERVPDVQAVVGVVSGNAAVEAGRRSRRTMVFGAGPEVPAIWAMRPAQGRFLPADGAARPVAVLGAKLHRELFRGAPALGARIRIGILTIMTIAVGERRAEIGLLRALGAGRGQILALFLLEATVLALLGGALGFMILETVVERPPGCVPRGVQQGTTRRNSRPIPTSCNAAGRRAGRAMGVVAALTREVTWKSVRILKLRKHL